MTGTVPLERGLELLGTTTEALCELLRAAPDPDRRIPHLEWTVGECAAHLVLSNRMYADQLTGPGIVLDIEQTAAANAWSLEGLGALDLRALGADLARTTEDLIALIRRMGPGTTFQYWSGSRARVETAVGLLIGERLVHGWDIAAATGDPWPIDPTAARLVLAASFEVMPLLVDRDAAADLSAVFDLRLRGGERYSLSFTDGSLAISTEPTRSDLHISADPVAMLLVGYGRISQWRALARGKILAWGRGPWLGLRFRGLLRNP